MSTEWTQVPISEVKPGDRVRHRSGQEFEVARVDPKFLGIDSMVCLIEDNPTRWHAYPASLTDQIDVSR
jgi:hypothetical protein